MSIDWQMIAVAIASKVQYEVACSRGRLLTEHVVRLALAEAIQSQVHGKLIPEFNHPDIPGNTSLDLIVMTPRDRKIEVACELKWVRKTTDKASRNWIQEIIGDLLRLECLNKDLKKQAERAIIIVGEASVLSSKIWNRKVNTRGKPKRRRVIGHLLPGKGHFKGDDAQRTRLIVDLKNQGAPFRSILKNASPEIYKKLPQSYLVDMAALHRTQTNGIECVIWTVSRPVGRRHPFNGESQWKGETPSEKQKTAFRAQRGPQGPREVPVTASPAQANSTVPRDVEIIPTT